MKKKILKYSSLFILSFIILFSGLLTISCTKNNELWKSTFTLPSEENVMERLNEIYGSREKMYIQGDMIQRMKCPENQEEITFNMTYEVSDYQKIMLEDAVREFNEVFSVVNPNYTFKINYSPSQEDFNQHYSIRMNVSDNLGDNSSRQILGLAHFSTGSYTGNYGITLKTEVLNRVDYFMLTFKHEFMHLLGAGDAYNNPNAEKTTVMQNYNNTSLRHFSKSDVAFIDAYYRNPANPLTDEQIKNYIVNYENSISHTQKNNIKLIYSKALQNIDLTTLQCDLQAKGYADTRELNGLIQTGINRDKTFGQTNVSFTELEYLERPNETYYGGFDIDKKNGYTHGTSKGSFSHSKSISYTDYGDGILYATPNGNANNNIIFIKLGNYILMLDLIGNYYNLNSLSFNFRTACKIN